MNRPSLLPRLRGVLLSLNLLGACAHGATPPTPAARRAPGPVQHVVVLTIDGLRPRRTCTRTRTA